MLSEKILDKRAEVVLDLMDSLSTAIKSQIETKPAADVSKLADSLTLLIVKLYEAENMGVVADNTTKLTRQVNRMGRSRDLGDLE